MDYIKKEDAIKAVCFGCNQEFSDKPCEPADCEIRQAVTDIPTADVAEVKHGEWKSLTECANAGVYCSVCHKKVYKEDYAWCNKRNKLRSDYCPNCGAKMDGGKI